MKNKISVVIVHWNTPEFLKKQLQGLYKFLLNLEIIVVDNASNTSLSWMKREFPSIILIQNKLNRGYAFACNQGVVKSRGDWLFFLNPDVEISRQQIEQLINYAQINQLDAFCPTPNSNDYHRPLPSWMSLVVEFTPLNKIIPLRIFRKKTLFGGCLLIKKYVLMSLGGWDERFFLWFEDSDLTARLLKANYKIGWAQVSINHIGAGSFKMLNEQFKRDVFFHSMNIFAKKHFSIFGKIIVGLIRKKYSKRNLLPEIQNGVIITVPNMKIELLEIFFKANKHVLSEIDELIVVTSALNSQTVWEWRKKYPQVRFIPIIKNEGFASTVNVGFRVASGKWVATVNDDVVLSNDWIKQCLLYSDRETGSINPLIYKQDKKIESAGVKISPQGKAFTLKPNNFSSDRVKSRNTCQEVDATNAAAVIYAREALNKVGLFDEKFGSYLEDLDLSLRLSRNGYKNLVSSKSSVIHQGQSSSINLRAKKQFLDFKNWIYVIIKNWGIKKIILNLPGIIGERLRNLSGIVKNLL